MEIAEPTEPAWKLGETPRNGGIDWFAHAERQVREAIAEAAAENRQVAHQTGTENLPSTP